MPSQTIGRIFPVVLTVEVRLGAGGDAPPKSGVGFQRAWSSPLPLPYEVGQHAFSALSCGFHHEIARAFRDHGSASRNIGDGIACIQYIQRHASIPAQKGAVDSPAAAARK